MKILKITNEDKVLAIQEIKSLSGNKKVVVHDVLVIADCNYKRLTYVESVFEEVTEKEVLAEDGSFKVSFENVKKDLDSHLITQLKNSGRSVNLKNPDHEYVFMDLGKGKGVILTRKIYKNEKTFLKRHPKLRPGFHPGACMPKFARVLVNLTGVKEGQILLDPFCGTGGILLEAADMGIVASGSDISEEMIEKSKMNLDHFHLRANLHISDAAKIGKDYDVIATELPFGKATELSMSVEELFRKFLASVHKHVPIIAVGLPIGVGFPKVYKTPGYDCTFEHDVYIHKSLSKRIMVLKRK